MRRTGRIIALTAVVSLAAVHGVYGQSPLPSKEYDLKMARGVNALNRQKYEEAEKAFLQALAARPNDVEATYSLGVVQLSQGRYELAEGTLQKVQTLDPRFGRVHLELGRVVFHMGRYDVALAALLKADKLDTGEDQRQAMIQYYLGLTYHKMERFQEAAPKLLRAAALSEELSVQARYLAGVAFYRQGLFEDAAEEFNEVIGREPSSEQAASAKQFLNEMEKTKPLRKPWGVSVSLGAQYDSNVILLPDPFPLPEGISNEGDVRLVGVLQGSYGFLETTRWLGGVKYSIYQSLHQDLDEFNVQSHDLGLSFLHRIPAMPYQFRFTYDLMDVLLDGEAYLIGHAAGLTTVLRPGLNGQTDILYRFQSRDFRESDRFPNNDDRTGTNHAAGVSHGRSVFGWGLRVQAGYTFDLESADGDDWDYRGHRLDLGLMFPRFYVDPSIKAELTIRNYDHPNSLSSDTPPDHREDTVQVYTVTLQRPINRWLTGTAQYAVQMNSSNIEVYDYDRQIVSVSVTAGF
jgi:tetratricopeptide (TPR) repeat protein